MLDKRLKELDDAIAGLRKDIADFQDLIAKPRIYVDEPVEKRFARLNQEKKRGV